MRTTGCRRQAEDVLAWLAQGRVTVSTMFVYTLCAECKYCKDHSPHLTLKISKNKSSGHAYATKGGGFGASENFAISPKIGV